MCSSPKSGVSIPKHSTKSIFASMDAETRKRFVITANKAQERKEQRLLKRKQAKLLKENAKEDSVNDAATDTHSKDSDLKNNKDSAQKRKGLLSILREIGFSV